MSALCAEENLVYTTSMLMLAGQDPNEMLINKVGCPDVGVKCGGWGNIIMEMKVVDRKR